MPTGPTYRFGVWRLDASQRLLFRDDKLVPLAPKLLETLLLLVQNRGRIVHKEEFVATVWQGAFVEDGSLLRNVSTLRKLLDEAGGRRLIETIPKRGYRFVGDVRVTPPVEAVADADTARPADASRVEPAPLARPGWRNAAALVVLGGLAVTGFVQWQSRPNDTHSVGTGGATLAVLPFQNLTGDPAQEYFADGLTEELITQLSRADPGVLSVIARTSSMKYKGARSSVKDVGRDLGVDYVLEGSVRREGSRTRISAQLIRVRDQIHLWARNYDRELGDLITMQDDVSSAIALQLGGALSTAGTPARRQPTTNSEAHDVYLQGRFYWNERSSEGLNKSLRYLHEATERDPSYALAYSGIADAYNLLVDYSFLSSREGHPLAQAAARKAIELDDSLGEAFASLAFSTFAYDHDWAGAETLFHRALRLSPSYALAHQWYARLLVTQGRFVEARAAARRALELDPFSVSARINIGHVDYLARNYDDVEREMRKILETEPAHPWANVYVTLAHLGRGRYAEALEAAVKARALSDGRPSFLEAYCHAVAGHRDEARAIRDYWAERRVDEHVDLVYLAGIDAALGEAAQAIARLETARLEKSHMVPYVTVFPWLDPLRAEPAFKAFLSRVKPRQ